MITFTTLRGEKVILETPEEIRAAITMAAVSLEEKGAPKILSDLLNQVIDLPWVEHAERDVLLHTLEGAITLAKAELIRERIRTSGEVMLDTLNLGYFEDTVGCHTLNEKLRVCNLSKSEINFFTKGRGN